MLQGFEDDSFCFEDHGGEGSRRFRGQSSEFREPGLGFGSSGFKEKFNAHMQIQLQKNSIIEFELEITVELFFLSIHRIGRQQPRWL